MGMADDWMVMLMTEKDTCHEMMNRSVEATIKCLRLVSPSGWQALLCVGDCADDSGSQRAEMISPDLWAEMIKPHYKKLCDWIQPQHTPGKHSCIRAGRCIT